MPDMGINLTNDQLFGMLKTFSIAAVNLNQKAGSIRNADVRDAVEEELHVTLTTLANVVGTLLTQWEK